MKNLARDWAIKQQITKQDFAARIGCSRIVLWKVDRNIPICKKYADKIEKVTEGQIKPLVKNPGRKSLKQVVNNSSDTQ
jgi:hypothetical protein